MGHIFSIEDSRTIYCKPRMRAHNGAWNPVTQAWMFGTAGNHANASCELYNATRASIAMRETLYEVLVDGTAAAAWNFDPRTQRSTSTRSNTPTRRSCSQPATQLGASSEFTRSKIAQSIARAKTTSCVT